MRSNIHFAFIHSQFIPVLYQNTTIGALQGACVLFWICNNEQHNKNHLGKGVSEHKPKHSRLQDETFSSKWKLSDTFFNLQESHIDCGHADSPLTWMNRGEAWQCYGSWASALAAMPSMPLSSTWRRATSFSSKQYLSYWSFHSYLKCSWHVF